MRPSRRQMLPFTRRWTEGRLTVTAVLIALHVAAFVAQLFVEFFNSDPVFGGLRSGEWIALSGAGVEAGRLWQFASFTLLHAGPFHALANVLILYFAGRELEPLIGGRNLFTLYMAGNILGGVAHWLAMPDVALVGISAGVVALLIAFTTILPEIEVTVNLFFVLPVRVKAKHLALALVSVCAAMCVVPTAPQIGPVAMLAAAIVGWLYARQLGFGNPLFFQRYLFEKRQRVARLSRMSADQFISAEIDPILEKISRQGMHSLSRAEKKILEQGREKIAARTAPK